MVLNTEWIDIYYIPFDYLIFTKQEIFFSLLNEKGIKNHEEYKILSFLYGDKLACHSFTGASAIVVAKGPALVPDPTAPVLTAQHREGQVALHRQWVVL